MLALLVPGVGMGGGGSATTVPQKFFASVMHDAIKASVMRQPIEASLEREQITARIVK